MWIDRLGIVTERPTPASPSRSGILDSVSLRVDVLGTPRIEVDGEPLHVDTRKAIAMLAYLAVSGGPQARELLVDLLWPDTDPDRGRAALRRTLSALRSALGGRWVTVSRAAERRAESVRRSAARPRSGSVSGQSRSTSSSRACGPPLTAR